MSFSSSMDSMGAGIVWRQCSFRVAQSWELRNLSKAVAQAELRNPRSCASRVAQSWKLRKRSCAILEVAQAKFRNPSCAIRRSCGIGLYSKNLATNNGPAYPICGRKFWNKEMTSAALILWYIFQYGIYFFGGSKKGYLKISQVMCLK